MLAAQKLCKAGTEVGTEFSNMEAICGPDRLRMVAGAKPVWKGQSNG